jgi:hypothetical protein
LTCGITGCKTESVNTSSTSSGHQEKAILQITFPSIIRLAIKSKCDITIFAALLILLLCYYLSQHLYKGVFLPLGLCFCIRALLLPGLRLQIQVLSFHE